MRTFVPLIVAMTQMVANMNLFLVMIATLVLMMSAILLVVVVIQSRNVTILMLVLLIPVEHQAVSSKKLIVMTTTSVVQTLVTLFWVVKIPGMSLVMIRMSVPRTHAALLKGV
jgi:hypothetical protein